VSGRQINKSQFCALGRHCLDIRVRPPRQRSTGGTTQKIKTKPRRKSSSIDRLGIDRLVIQVTVGRHIMTYRARGRSIIEVILVCASWAAVASRLLGRLLISIPYFFRLHRPLRSLPFSSALSLFFVLATIFERNALKRGSGKGETPKLLHKHTPRTGALVVTKRRPNRTGPEYRPRVAAVRLFGSMEKAL
jgi:hypothetical protein